MNSTYFSWEAGQTVILRCYVSSSEDATESVFWIFETSNGFKTITPSTNSDKYRGSSVSYPSLIILNLTYADSGSYRCAATNEYGTGISKTALFLNVTGKSLSVTATRLFYNVELGDNVTLGVSIYPQESVLLSVQWVFHHKGIEQKINVSGSAKYFGSSLERPSLLIINLKTDDIGNYRCIAESSYGTGESGQIVLQIKDIPSVDIGSEALNSSYGDSVTLECNVSSQTALNKIYWERNSSGNVITITSDTTGIHGVSIANPGLTINVTTNSDSGFYTCVAENSYGIGKSIPIRLDIEGGIPVVKVHETVVNAVYGISVTLHVTINSAPEHFSIYWTKFVGNATEMIHNGMIGTSGGNISSPSLTIRFPTASNVGIYKCYAKNVLGLGSSVNISLVVVGDIPTAKVEVREQTAHFGEEITIQCTVQSDPHHATVYWEKRNGDKITTLTSQTKGIRGITIVVPSLTIMFVTSTDNGTYTCYAENSVGVGKSKTIKLNVIAGK
ncbi:contactin-4-like [Mytilus galloprovincialis]|uniref:contactin-4-like n=1 Tax=Mytilus galloprovincialis TaxID=29158 RepID=UPI003F7B6D2B